MMKITIIHPEEVRFDELKMGEIFVSNNIAYMKIQDNYFISAELKKMFLEGNANYIDFEQSRVNAVSLRSGGTVYFRKQEQVFKVKNAELTVNT